MPWQARAPNLHISRARRAVTRTTEGAVCQQVSPGLPSTGFGLSRRVALQPNPRPVHGASRLRCPLVRPAWLHQEQGGINDSHVRGYAFCICRLKLWFIIFKLLLRLATSIWLIKPSRSVLYDRVVLRIYLHYYQHKGNAIDFLTNAHPC